MSIKINTFVKGIHEFGRKALSSSRASFEMISCDMPSVGVYMLYLYPGNGTHLLYRLETIGDTFTKDLPYIITGTMHLIKLTEQTEEVFGAVHLEFQKFDNLVHH